MDIREQVDNFYISRKMWVDIKREDSKGKSTRE